MFSVTNLSAHYGRIQVLHAVDLTVKAGEIAALMGTNGAGKSTLCKTVMGLLRATSGSVSLGGEVLTNLRTREIVSKGIALVPEARQLFANMSVVENLKLGAYIRADPEAITADIESMYELFPILGERRHQPSGLLSGGEQQMLAMARGLMARPTVLILDEPSQGLSPALVEQLTDAIRRIADQGTAVLLVEQNLAIPEQIADRAYVLASGRVALSGSRADVFDSSALLDAYLARSANPV
jgi:branched-chain amino acid transport system ATP-binding protein